MAEEYRGGLACSDRKPPRGLELVRSELFDESKPYGSLLLPLLRIGAAR